MEKQENKKTALQDTLNMLEGALAFKAQMQNEEEKRQVNVRLQLGELELLDALAEHYDETRTSMAQHLLSSAIHDALSITGIDDTEVYKRARAEKGKLE